MTRVAMGGEPLLRRAGKPIGAIAPRILQSAASNDFPHDWIMAPPSGPAGTLRQAPRPRPLPVRRSERRAPHHRRTHRRRGRMEAPPPRTPVLAFAGGQEGARGDLAAWVEALGVAPGRGQGERNWRGGWWRNRETGWVDVCRQIRISGIGCLHPGVYAFPGGGVLPKHQVELIHGGHRHKRGSASPSCSRNLERCRVRHSRSLCGKATCTTAQVVGHFMGFSRLSRYESFGQRPNLRKLCSDIRREQSQAAGAED